MTYSLKKVGDHPVGDSGGMSMLLWVDKDGKVQSEHNARPRVGTCIRVGSIYARTYQSQDWWQTSNIEEILVDELRYVKFRTRNSIYEWKC